MRTVLHHMCPQHVPSEKLSSRRSHKLKSAETINLGAVSAALLNHSHIHIFQNPNSFPQLEKKKTKSQGIIQCYL